MPPIPPIPPPGPPGIAGLCFFGTSATIASVVMSRPATEAAPCSAARTTLVGSMMPFEECDLERGDRPGRHYLGQWRCRNRSFHRRCNEKGRQRGDAPQAARGRRGGAGAYGTRIRMQLIWNVIVPADGTRTATVGNGDFGTSSL